MHEDFDFDGEAEMKTLQEVHDMLVLTGYKEEAHTVANAIKAISVCDMFMDSLERIQNICKDAEEQSEEMIK